MDIFDFQGIGYLVLELAPYLVVAAVIGLVTGWFAVRRPERGRD